MQESKYKKTFLEKKNTNFAYCKTKYGFQMYMSPFCSSPIYFFTVEALFFMKNFEV